MKKSKIFCLVLVFSLVLTLLLAVIPADEAHAAVIKYGSRGTTVRTIQSKLRSWGYYSGSVDGVFGYKTQTAVKYFQRTNGLTADGMVGSRTASAMGIKLTAQAATVTGSNVTDSDLYLLSCCIYGEARGESYTGKVAVAAVILNRVKSSKFPNTIAGVIYQSGAFTCVSDGQINMGTNDECTRAAKDALNGWDPTYGCTFYYNPITATSSWIRSKPVVTTIGKHVFCA